MKIDPNVSWMRDHHPASHWRKHSEGSDVVCNLSPRHCRISDGNMGKCGVRGNVGGELYTFNYGKSVAATVEFIETEAVNHYRPGARIISFGNIGCMMSCDFCQNWKTSQVRHLNERDVQTYTPTEIVETCKLLGVEVISWTYNDPVVWHEFVVETSRLAKQAGLTTLYKSAFYIESDAVDELIECIDIFSISLKSMEDKFYRKFTGGAHLQPVLDMIKKVHASGRHLEVSQLLITDRNDNDDEIHKTNKWVVENLGTHVPLHYVAFHPAYLYTATTRTAPEKVLRARELALAAGIRYCYAGNMHKAGVADTTCPNCGTTTVSRFGLTATPVALDEHGCCTNCGDSNDIKFPFGGRSNIGAVAASETQGFGREFAWNAEAKSVHIEIDVSGKLACPIQVERLGKAGSAPQQYVVGGVVHRIIVSKQSDEETGIRITAPAGMEVTFFPVLDRAHFPTSQNLDEELAGYEKKLVTT